MFLLFSTFLFDMKLRDQQNKTEPYFLIKMHFYLESKLFETWNTLQCFR